MVTKKVHIGFFFLVAVSIITISPCPLGASEVSLFDKPLRYFGVLSQTFAYGWNDDYDTYKGFNQATTTAFLEGDYSPIDNFSLYSMLSLTGDLAYAINNDSEKWNNRQFDKAGEDLAFDDEYWRILKELHGTWNINTALIRVGKQIVSWGELTGVRLLDQINPSDSTRGISDIEFETSIVPTWLVRTDFRLPVNSALVSDATLQFVYDPNVDNDIYSRSFLPGNDVMGVWAPYIEVGGSSALLMGSQTLTMDKPDEWTDGKFGARLQAQIGDALASINFLYGRDFMPLFRLTGIETEVVSGQAIAHPTRYAYFPVRKMIGGMLAKELEFIPRIGGMNTPMFRMEWAYMWDCTFLTKDYSQYVTRDDQRVAAVLETGIPIRALNPSALFKVTAQYSVRHITGVDPGYDNYVVTSEGPARKYNQNTMLAVTTFYWGARIQPIINWIQDWTNDAYMLKSVLNYKYSDRWQHSITALFVGGSKKGFSFEQFEHKDYIAYKIRYSF